MTFTGCRHSLWEGAGAPPGAEQTTVMIITGMVRRKIQQTQGQSMATSRPPSSGNTTLPTVAATEFWAFILTSSAPLKMVGDVDAVERVIRPMPMPMRMLDRNSSGTLVLAQKNPMTPPARRSAGQGAYVFQGWPAFPARCTEESHHRHSGGRGKISCMVDNRIIRISLNQVCNNQRYNVF